MLCNLWCHKACTNLSNEAFKGLEVQAQEVGIAYWACRSCASFAFRVNKQLEDATRRQDEVVIKLDNTIQHVQQNTNRIDKLEDEMRRMRMERDAEREAKTDMLAEELRDCEMRRNNLIIHGLAENASNNNARDRMEYDKQQCGDILQSAFLFGASHYH
jgi:hypothetical protein